MELYYENNRDYNQEKNKAYETWAESYHKLALPALVSHFLLIFPVFDPLRVAPWQSTTTIRLAH